MQEKQALATSLIDRLPTEDDERSGLEGWEPFDHDDPRSLINIAPPEIRKQILAVPKEWLILSETELASFISVEPFVGRLRLAFWAEYEYAQSQMLSMSVNRIALRLGAPSKLLLIQFRSTERMAWVLCPPGSYEAYLDESLNFGMKRLREDLLTANIKRPDGTLDHKAAELLLKAVAFIDMRKNGGIMQRSQTQLIAGTPKDFKQIGEAMSLKEIEARIQELEAPKMQVPEVIAKGSTEGEI